MYYILIRPPVSNSTIIKCIRDMLSERTRAFDGVVLSNLVGVCYECALKKNELVSLSIRDVATKGEVHETLLVNGSRIELAGNAIKIFKKHIDYMKTKSYRMYPTSPLFPAVNNKRYSERNLHNHLQKVFGDDIKLGLERIRQAGICNFYEKMKIKRHSPKQCLELTARFARNSERHTEDLLQGKIQTSGKKISPFSLYLKKIGEIESKSIHVDERLKRIDDLRIHIGNDEKLNDESRAALLDELARVKNRIDKSAPLLTAETEKRVKQSPSLSDIVLDYDDLDE